MATKMATDWVEYKCKSGQTLFIYNKVTGEHKWPSGNESTEENCAMFGEPVIYKEIRSIGTQTDDDGCENGCTSMYVNTSNQDISHIETSPLQEQGVLIAVGDNLDIETGGGNKERGTDMGVINVMLKETDANNLNRNKAKHNDKNWEIELQKEDGNYTEHLKVFTSDKDSGTRNNSVQDLLNEGEQTDLKLSYGILSKYTGEKPFKCSYCKKKFNQKGDLIRHIRTHTKEKPFECSYCKKKFNQKATLIDHIRTHTGEKPFECPFCKKKFPYKFYLVIHIRTHTGEKPFECSYCKKKFNQKTNLIKHIKIHTGERPFECSHCKKKFNQKTNLIRHIRTHTGENLWVFFLQKGIFSQEKLVISFKNTHLKELFGSSYTSKRNLLK